MYHNELLLDLRHMEFHQVLPKIFQCPWYIWHKPCTYLAPRLELSPNKLQQASTWPTSPRSSIGCTQKNFWAYCMFGASHAPILHGDSHYLQTDQNELVFDPRHQDGPSSEAKKISMPVVYSAQIVHLALRLTLYANEQNELSLDPRPQGVP
jgi:hypothetical protein